MNALRSAITALTILLLAPVGPLFAQPGSGHATEITNARNAAQSWLALVDGDQFGTSWDEAAVLLQNRTKRAAWIQNAERLRDSVQTVSARTLTRTQYRDTLQRASSDGPFVLLKYRSTFPVGRFEELVLTVRQDTTWKVAGYQVTPIPTDTSAAPLRSPSP